MKIDRLLMPMWPGGNYKNTITFELLDDLVQIVTGCKPLAVLSLQGENLTLPGLLPSFIIVSLTSVLPLFLQSLGKTVIYVCHPTIASQFLCCASWCSWCFPLNVCACDVFYFVFACMYYVRVLQGCLASFPQYKLIMFYNLNSSFPEPQHVQPGRFFLTSSYLIHLLLLLSCGQECLSRFKVWQSSQELGVGKSTFWFHTDAERTGMVKIWRIWEWKIVSTSWKND